ncbi:MAG: NADH-quinone oxidoreductase subunit C [Desulfonauticus sp.]|nr:NADH-quinone oxidoreductase subunit C [Desulfonauticus sp.]
MTKEGLGHVLEVKPGFCALLATGKVGYKKQLFILPDDLLNVVKHLDECGYALENITALEIEEGFLLVYHFNQWNNGEKLALKVLLTDGVKEIDSISDVYPGALWHERECFDFFGIVFKNHSNLIPLLLDPKENIHPLLKAKNKRQPLAAIMPESEKIEQYIKIEELGK